MGATNFHDSIDGCDNANDAYRALVDEAIYEYGNNIYNGTISTTNGFEYLGEIDKNNLHQFIEEHTDNYHKWSKCGCVRTKVGEEPHARYTFHFFGWVAL